MTAIGDSTPVKTCTKCGECKPATTDFFHKSSRDGLAPACKACALEQKRLAYLQNADVFKARVSQYRAKDPEKHRASCRQWHAANKDKVKAADAIYYRNNKAKVSASNRAYHAMNAEALRSSAMERYRKNKQAAFERNIRNTKKRKLVDPAFALSVLIRSSINNHMRKGGWTKKSRTQQILGCTWDEFKSHIERQFLRGMSWENRHLWHLDHIVPMAKAKSAEDVVALNHFTNLRPMWAKDNIRKSDAITHLI